MRGIIQKGIVLYVIIFLSLLLWWSSTIRVKKGEKKNVFQRQEGYNQFDSIRDFNRTNVENVNSRILQLLLKGTKDVQPEMTSWRWSEGLGREIASSKESYCNDQFIVYDNLFAKLTNVTLDPKYGVGRTGGESISSVLNQNEDDEYFKLRTGYFSVSPCDTAVPVLFRGTSHLNTWLNSTSFLKSTPSVSDYQEIGDWTIAVLRYEYANLYHTMTDYYSAFLLAKAFNMSIGNITILWIDGHPYGALDDTWRVLFGNVLRAGKITKPVRFRNMIWNIQGYQSYLNQHNLAKVPYLEEFRRFFLTQHNVDHRGELNCDNLTVTFIWRRDYLAHPRNPSGMVSRKIKNEQELLVNVKNILPNHTVIGIQIDTYPMKQQLYIISQTDILIGMHGAGLSHTLFLPDHAGLIELYPIYWSTANKHFKAMANWRHLHYHMWNNVDENNEVENKQTVINVGAVVTRVKELVKKMCH